MKIHIPTPLRAFTEGQETIGVSATNVSGALDALTTQFPALRQHLFTAEGKTRSFVNIYLNDDDVRYLPEKEAAPVQESDELTIIPSIAGGCCLCCL